MHDPLILTITLGLAAALVLGYITHRLGLSPIVGYLLAGLAVGPHTPGPVADVHIASQLAEVGVVLLLFGVGLHFRWRDRVAARAVALPGAIGQSLVATLLGTAAAAAFGWPAPAGVVLGIAIAVASTVVLIRVLMDNHCLATPAGHAAVGWLVVEDIIIVMVLVLLPATVSASHAGGGASLAWSLAISLGKLALLGVLMALIGVRLIPWLMERVARSRSRELFTLTVLVVALGIALGSAWAFGASMALGAFLAGMVVGQSNVSHQAASDALPMRDAFAVLFFVSVGMLFDPRAVVDHPGQLLVILGIILLAKPAAALAIVALMGKPVRTALTVALGLAQIGEFSFILSNMGRSLGVMPEGGHNLLVAAALISISINPILFRQVGRVENWLARRKAVWRLLTWRNRQQNALPRPANDESPAVRAVVVGYGPVGRILTRILRDLGIEPTIVDLNLATIKAAKAQHLAAVYGDALRPEILQAASIETAGYLLVTLPQPGDALPVVAEARALNSGIRVLVRARFLSERPQWENAGIAAVAYGEAETAVALAGVLLREIGLSEEAIAREAARVRADLNAQTL